MRMRMRGNLGNIATMVRATYAANGHEARNVNGGGGTMIPAGSSYSAPVATAQPIASAAELTVLPRSSGITATHLRPDASGPVTAQAAPIIRAGPSATSGAASPATTYYGAGGSYYGAPDSADAAKTADAKKGGAWLPIGLILWALFGT